MTRSMRIALVFAALMVPAAAFAQTSASFDVERATRAYLDLLQGPARAKSDAYFEGGYWLTLWNMVAAIAIYLVILASGLSARMRDWAERVTRRRWLVPAVYALPLAVASALLLLPWTIYTDFVRERQYDLMSLGFGAWLIDQAKLLGLSIVMNALLFGALFAVIRRFPRGWWVLGAGVFSGFVALVVLVAPVFIVPLFFTMTELPASPLRDRIVAIAAANRIPAEHIEVADASRQTKRISANVSGLGPTIRITLNDNLLARTAPNEVVAVMGHEMGHYVLHHLWKTIALYTIVFLLVFFCIARAAPRLIARHPRWQVRDVADPAAAPVLLLLGAIAGFVLTPVQNTIVRVFESEADAFGLDAAREPDGFAMIAMRLSEYRKIEPGPIEEALFFDHPSGATRVRMSMQWKQDHVAGAAMVAPTMAPPTMALGGK